MDLSELINEINSLRPQIASESDPALRREMKKTYKHYHKQLRKLMTHRKPWYGLSRLVVFLAFVYLLMVYVCIYFEMSYGSRNTVLAVIMAAIALVLITAMVFLVMKVISPETYTELVQASLDSLNKLRTAKGETNISSHSTEHLDQGTVLRLPPSVPVPTSPVPQISPDGPSIPSLSAGEASPPESIPKG